MIGVKLMLNSLKSHDFEMSREDKHRRKALYLQDLMCNQTLQNITRRYTQEKSPLPAGCATRHSETSREDKHRRKAICLQDVLRDILKCH